MCDAQFLRVSLRVIPRPIEIVRPVDRDERKMNRFPNIV
jgi:hypothetical protein